MFAISACGGQDSTAGGGISLDRTGGDGPRKLNRPNIQPPSTTPEELVIRDRIEGIGPSSKAEDELTAEYFGVHEDGKASYSSWDGTPPLEFSFELGAGGYPQGLEEGLEGMKVGGRRELLIPSDLMGGLESTFYVIDLIEINRGDQCWRAQVISQADYTNQRRERRPPCPNRVRVP